MIACALGVAARGAFFSACHARFPEMPDGPTVDKDEEWEKAKRRHLECDLLVSDDWPPGESGGKRVCEPLEITESRLGTGSS